MIDVVLAWCAVAVLLVAGCMLGGWWMRRRDRLGRHVATGGGSAAPASGRARGQRLGRVGRGVEARLVARLLADEVTAGQYRDAMAVLAAEDALRHPVVPEG